jgi:hypothetical protein
MNNAARKVSEKTPNGRAPARCIQADIQLLPGQRNQLADDRSRLSASAYPHPRNVGTAL